MSNTLKLGNGQWATGKDTILAYNDLNSNYKPLAFSFSRDSSATVVNKAGLIETVGSGEPRIDFKDNTKGALLLEPSRSNFLPYSTLDFNGGVKPNGWSIGFGTGSYSYEQLEYKGQKAVKQTQITTGRSYLDTGTITILANTEHTLKIQFILDECIADANDDVVVMLGFGNDVSYQFSDIDENGILEFQYNPLSDNIGNIRIGLGCNGNEDGGKSLAWAIPQLEQGSYATSYIPTSGSAVTRSADACNNGGNEQVINSTEGVLYAEIKGFISQDTIEPNRYITITNGTSNERVALLLGGNSNQLRAVIYSSTQSVNLSFTTSLTDVKQYNKLAVKYKSGDYAFFLNGVKIGGSTETSIFSENTLNDFSFDVGGGTQQFRGMVKGAKLYNTALTDQELIALTS